MTTEPKGKPEKNMRAAREEETLRFWQEKRIFEKSLEQTEGG